LKRQYCKKDDTTWFSAGYEENEASEKKGEAKDAIPVSGPTPEGSHQEGVPLRQGL
jgi:hypothetical protein